MSKKHSIILIGGAIVLVVTTLIMGGCNLEQPITPMPDVITDSNECAGACAHLAELGCTEGKPVYAGTKCNGDHECNPGDDCVDRFCMTSCEKFCRDTQRNGVWLSPSCVKDITSCDQVNACPTR